LTTVSTLFRVGISNVAVVGQAINFNYVVGGSGSSLTEIYYVALAYRSAALPANVSFIDFFLHSAYTSIIAYLDSNVPGPNAFLTGYNRKCVISLQFISIWDTGLFKFDSNYASPTLNYTQGSSAVVVPNIISLCLL
jgi:hypothetical protein